MTQLSFVPLDPTVEIADAFTRWENDPVLVPLSRPNQSADDIATQQNVTVNELYKRMAHQQITLIYLDEQLVGEMSYQVDPAHLFKKEEGTAWIGITIGEEYGRNQGIGRLALNHLEEQIRAKD